MHPYICDFLNIVVFFLSIEGEVMKGIGKAFQGLPKRGLDLRQ